MHRCASLIHAPNVRELLRTPRPGLEPHGEHAMATHNRHTTSTHCALVLGAFQRHHVIQRVRDPTGVIDVLRKLRLR